MDFWDEVIARSLEKLWELLGKSSSFLSYAAVDHLSLCLSGLHALVLHEHSFDNDNRAENHSSKDCVFEGNSSSWTEGQKTSSNCSSDDLIDGSFFLANGDECAISDGEESCPQCEAAWMVSGLPPSIGARFLRSEIPPMSLSFFGEYHMPRRK